MYDAGPEARQQLQVFDSDSYGFDQLPPGNTSPESFLRPETANIARNITRESLQLFMKSERLSQLQPIVASGEYAQQEPLFVDIKKDGDQIKWKLNQSAKPLVWHLSSCAAYTQAEALTDNDSSLYGLVAATVGETGVRRDLYVAMARLICRGVQQAPDISQRMEQVFLGKDQLAPALAIVAVGNRGDLFPDIRINSEEDLRLNYSQELVERWTEQWQTMAKALEEKLTLGEDLSLKDIKNLEIISHLFKVDKIIEEVVTTASTPIPKQRNVQESTSTESHKVSEADIRQEEDKQLISELNTFWSQGSLNHPERGYDTNSRGYILRQAIETTAKARIRRQQPNLPDTQIDNPTLDREMNEIENFFVTSISKAIDEERGLMKRHALHRRLLDMKALIYADNAIRKARRSTLKYAKS